MANSAGKKIGKYEVIRELGNGSVGLVYKARDPNLNRIVAIKVLKTLSLGDQDDENNMALKRFYHEAQMACMLKHPNIITVFDAGVTELGAPYIVMEYVEGKDLGDIIDERGAIPTDETLKYLTPIAKAIDYAHTQGIIHRDIKPSNIVISSNSVPYLLDFSVAKLHDTSMTPAGTLLGTPEYMAPEQILGYKLDHRVDLFAFGVVLFETFTGQIPFEANDLMGTATMIVKNPPQRFADIGCDLPEALETVLHKALDKNPDHRYQTAEQLISNVVSALARSSGSHKRPTRPDIDKLKETVVSQTPRPSSAEWSINNDWKMTSQSPHETQPQPKLKSFQNGQLNLKAQQTSSPTGFIYLSLFCGFAAIVGIVYYLLSSTFSPAMAPSSLPTSNASYQEAPTPEASLESVQELQNIHALSNSDLIKLLQNNPNVFALRQIIPEASKRQFPELLALSTQYAKHPDYYVKVEVLKLLIANPQFLPPEKKLGTIVDMLNDSDHLVRGFAIKALATIGTKEAKNAIQQHQQRETNPVVRSVINDELSKF